MNLQQVLVERFYCAVSELGVEGAPIPVSKSTRPEFGEYQFNGAMALAKQLRKKPRDIATELMQKLSIDDLASKVEIAGPGFINVHLSSAFLSEWATNALQQADLGIQKQKSENIVVDLSSPNLAKEMHVGHLRSTIIGDATSNVLEALGHKVIRQNHMGDWGTQFGMLLAHFSDKLDASEAAETALSDLEVFYRQAKVRFDDEDGFADRARAYVVKLQSGDEECLSLWGRFIDISIAHSEEVYSKLNVKLTRNDVMGESAYNDDLATIISELEATNLAVEDQGAKVVFLPELADKEGNPAVYIVQKSGGGYLYSTTDLAAIRYRTKRLNADRILIFTDARQALHFKQTEIVARKANFLPEHVKYDHCPFGMMLGKDGKPFKTRTGGTIKLSDLLDEAIDRAKSLVSQRDNSLSESEQNEVARVVGIGAVKYADLSKNRMTDYVFDWDSMLSFEGNTAPYLQYAYTRIKSIFRKASIDMSTFTANVTIVSDSERMLATKLVQFEEALSAVARDATPHILCAYMYELASTFMRFYEADPILKPDVEPSVRDSRLALSALTANTLKTSLDLLGIETLENM